MTPYGRTDDRFAAAPGWRGRIAAFARLLAFAAVFIAASYGCSVALAGIQRHVTTLGSHILLSMGANGAAAILLIAVMARVSGHPFGHYGYAGQNKFRNFFIGIVSAAVLLAVQLLIEAALGYFAFGYVTADTGALAWFGPFYAVLFLVVGLTEESLFRGYVLVELSRAISFWPAAILLSVMFGLPHWLKGGGESVIGGIQAGLLGLVLAYSFRRTGSLWFAIGAHAGWDYGETFIFGVPNSALKFEGSALHPAFHGPDWLSGGAAGPEGSVLSIFPLAALAFAAWWIGRSRPMQSDAS